MEGSSIVGVQKIVVPIAIRGKAIRKIRPNESTTSSSTLKENVNVKSHWQQLTKTRTVLLNDVLNKSNGCWRNGNLVITKMTPEEATAQLLHPFKIAFKTKL